MFFSLFKEKEFQVYINNQLSKGSTTRFNELYSNLQRTNYDTSYPSM